MILWDGWSAQFQVVNRLSLLALKPPIQTSSVKSTRLFNSATGVDMEFKAKGRAGQPTMHFKYGGSSRYSLQAYDSPLKAIDSGIARRSIKNK